MYRNQTQTNAKQQTRHQEPATHQTITHIFFSKVLRANHGRICYEKAIFSMPPFDTVAPSTPLIGVPRNMEEMKMCQ